MYRTKAMSNTDFRNPDFKSNFGERFSFNSCALWPRMTNSWVGFLIWTASVSLAAKSKTSAVKIENLIF